MNDKLLELYYSMLRIRRVEEKISALYWDNEMHTPIHLCIGQEAIAAGVCNNLNKEDYIFSNHRGHGHYLAKGGNLKAMIAELYNKETGCSKGRGGSMHLVDLDAGVQGTSSIVAGGVPIGTGSAFSFKMKNEKRVSIVFLGDAAVEEGVVYESINFAVLKNLPVIYVCENNFYAVCSSLKDRQSNVEIYQKFQGLNIPSYKIDGNDILEISNLFDKLVSKVREGNGPFFVECVTYRLMDHHATKTGVELGYRTQEEWEMWKAKCPIIRFEKHLMAEGILNEEIKIKLENRISEEIEEAFKFAKESPLPDRSNLLYGLYS